MSDLSNVYVALQKADAAGDVAGAKQLADYIRSQSAPPTPTPTPKRQQGFAENAIGAIYEPLANMATSMIAKPVSDIAGLAATAKEAISPSPPGSATPEDFKNEVQRRMTYEPRTDAGKVTTEYNPLALLGKGVNAVGQGIGNAVQGTSSPSDPRGMAGNAIHEAVNQVPGLVMSSPALRGAVSEAGTGSAQRLMHSALKPVLSSLQKGDAQRAIGTLLDEGVNVTPGGVGKLHGKIDDINTQIANALANSNATVNKVQATSPLADVLARVTKQVNPQADMAAVDTAQQNFLNHPSLSDDIPVQLAQEVKQGTYRELNKKYGEIGSADTEAQKALARGLKEGIAKAVPGIEDLNAQDSKLINALNVTERRVLIDANRNPLGLATLAHNPKTWALFMADKSPLFKSLVARALNTAGPAAASAMPAMGVGTNVEAGNANMKAALAGALK